MQLQVLEPSVFAGESSGWRQALHSLGAQLQAAPQPGRWTVRGLRAGARPFLLFRLLSDSKRPALVIVSQAKLAERFADDLRFLFGEEGATSPFGRRVHYLPAWDVAPFEDLSPPPEIVAARIEGLYHLRQTPAAIVLTTPEALLQRVPALKEFGARYAYLVEGEEIDRDSLARQLADWGYRPVPLVEDRGDFGIRGGIVDVFPPAHAHPIRIQLDGDRIDSMHEFDRVSQRLIARQPELLLLPMREFALAAGQAPETLRAVEARALELEISRRERNVMLEGLATGLSFPGVEFCLPYFHGRLDSVFDYLSSETVVWIDDPGGVEAAAEEFSSQVKNRAAVRATEHRFYCPPESLFLSPAEWRAALERRPVVEMEPLEVISGSERKSEISVHSFATTELKVRRVHQRREVTFGPTARQIREWCEQGYNVFLVAGSEPQCARLARLLENHEIRVDTPSAPFRVLVQQRSHVPRIVRGHFRAGFRLPDERLVVITEADLFGDVRRQAAQPVSVARLLKDLSELKPEDYVVHLDHGIGIYKGLRHMCVANTEGDFLHLEYAGGDRLYLPVDRIGLVQKYVGADGAVPSLDKLGGTTWERVKKKTRESVLAMAKELLAIYAAREVHERKGLSPPDAYYREFEAAFEFEETPDQKQAIDDVVADLQRTRPMDRLICGDVGYGKTEVAMRAAFLAVMEGRQVAVLVPTTVLAQQHLHTFRQRFEGYPVRVEMLSRFLTAAQIREVLRGIREGTVDIVIGTHRLLQRDVDFKQLGLLVVDEEHRFGVRHKERIKEMRKLVDVLTLTATPIPRTLHMALTGIRELSVIETPPIDRLAVRTYVTRYDEKVIRDAILRELGRKGQVFFVHNRVENIEAMARHLRDLVPEATFAVAHGQMHERELEKVMLDFLSRKIDVLVCSSIIESGLDIPNANTIIINRADHFGLAQLYQLRGRVGRSHERAFAYLMIPGEHLISRDAQQRLRVLQELDDLGGGFRLAAEDLEIRGAGNMLGREQSGHITTVGFELYTRMLEEAVQELRGEPLQPEVEPEIQLGIPAYIPESYIPDENQRVVFYRRLAGIKTSADLDDIAAELSERYGRIPPLVDSLLRIMGLRRLLKNCMVLRAIKVGAIVTLQFHPEAPVDVNRLVEMVKRDPVRFRLTEDFQLRVTTTAHDSDGVVAEVESVLEKVRLSRSRT